MLVESHNSESFVLPMVVYNTVLLLFIQTDVSVHAWLDCGVYFFRGGGEVYRVVAVFLGLNSNVIMSFFSIFVEEEVVMRLPIKIRPCGSARPLLDIDAGAISVLGVEGDEYRPFFIVLELVKGQGMFVKI